MEEDENGKKRVGDHDQFEVGDGNVAIDIDAIGFFFFFKQKTAYEIGLGILAEPLFRSNGGFLHCIQMDTSVNAANQVVSVGADIAFDADPKFFACLVRFESSSVPTTLPTAYDVYPL